jgi:hypothetical protein
MLPFIIDLLITKTAVIWWIYHTEITDKFNKVYNSESNNNDDEINKLESEYWLDKDIEKLDNYNKTSDLWSSLYKLNENWKYLLMVWNRLNTDMYKSLKEFQKLWDSLNKRNTEKLLEILEKYKKNTSLQKIFINSELKKRNCINMNTSHLNYDNKWLAEIAAAEKAAAESNIDDISDTSSNLNWF